MTFTCVMIVDAIFISNFFGSSGQTAVTFLMPLILFLNSILFSIVIGTNTYIGHAVGKKDFKEFNKVLNTGLIYGFLLVTIIALILIFNLKSYVNLFTKDLEIVKYTLLYGVPSILVYVINFVVLQYYFLQRLIDNIKIMKYISLLSLVCNIVLNTIFVFIIPMGIFGIAFASLVTVMIQLLVLIYINKKQNKEYIKFKLYKLDYKLFTKIFFNGLSDGIYDLSQSFMYIINIVIIVYLLGTDALVYLYIFSQVLNIQFIIFFALSDSLNPLIATAYGQKDFKKVEAYKQNSIQIAIVLSIVVYMAVVVFKYFVFKLYGADATQMPYLIANSYIYFLVVFIWPINQIYTSYYTAVGKTMVSLIFGIIRNLICIFLVTFGMVYLFLDKGLWSAYFVSEVIMFLGIYYYTKHNNNKLV